MLYKKFKSQQINLGKIIKTCGELERKKTVYIVAFSKILNQAQRIYT